MKVLLIAWFDPNGIKAIVDHISAIQNLSSNKIEVFNAYEMNSKLRRFFRVSLLSYDAIILHNTVTYNTDLLRSLSGKFFPSLKSFRGLKVIMKQDEMRKINEIKSIISDWRINVITTCLDEENVGKVYGEVLNRMTAVHTLTGYVTKEMMDRTPRPLDQRTLDVVYRGMESPFEWGTLGYEKFSIGENFRKYTADSNLKLDISSQNQDRIYGEAWIEFLSSSRATLAVESGASVFDFDGSIEKKCADYRKNNPGASFLDVYRDFLKEHDGHIKYNQISPRHIEATSLGTVQIMFEGEYSNIYKPYQHYIPLKKDFSNISEVVDLLRDDTFCNKIVTDSRNEILPREDLTFKHFVQKLDQALAHT